MPPDPSPARTEQALLERYAALAYDRQTDLYQVIGDNAWNADLDAGTISFGATAHRVPGAAGLFQRRRHR